MKRMLLLSLSTAAVAALTATAWLAPQPASADADSAPQAAGDQDSVMLEFDAPHAAQGIVERMRSEKIDVQMLHLAGRSGVGEIKVIPGSTPEQISKDADRAFKAVGTTAPSVTAAAVKLPQQEDPDALAGKFNAKVVPLNNKRAAPKDVAPSTTRATNVNTWDSWYPNNWKQQSYNARMCTKRQNDECVRWSNVSDIYQEFSWSGSHSTQSWPEPDWGLEIGLDLYNYAMCDWHEGDMYKWWASDSIDHWTTDIPEAAAPYYDDVRTFDDCSRMTQQFGIGYPANLDRPSGAKYAFELAAYSTPGNFESGYGAGSQVVSNDCTGTPESSCMGLLSGSGNGALRKWPHGASYQIFVNQDRLALVPGCAWMEEGWSAPFFSANGDSELVPDPIGYYALCPPNDFSNF